MLGYKRDVHLEYCGVLKPQMRAIKSVTSLYLQTYKGNKHNNICCVLSSFSFKKKKKDNLSIDEGSEEMVLVPGPPTKPISSLFPSKKGNSSARVQLFSFKGMLGETVKAEPIKGGQGDKMGNVK